MSPAKLWLRIYLAGFAVVTALLLVTLFTPIAYGDLTRIGRLSETEFGWRRPPPPIPQDSMRAVPVNQADILVIGDSFSMTYMWQSELMRAGYKVTTIYWGQYSETMCSDLQSWLEKAGFHGKLVIFESVERLLKDRMKRSTQCAHMTAPFGSREKPLIEVAKAVPGFELNSGSSLVTGLTTWLHTRTALKTEADTKFGFGALVRKVPDGCAQFSNKRCDRSLFFHEDLENGPLDAEDFARMKQFNADHAAMQFIWMVVPDKTTTYLDPDKSRGFREPFQAARLGPDLFAMTAENRMKVKDLYFPNDTHLSMHGQALLGQRMLEEVRKVLPQPPARLP